MEGGVGADTTWPGPDGDQVFAYQGDDVIQLRDDNRVDTVKCHLGTDTVVFHGASTRWTILLGARSESTSATETP